MSDWNWFYSSIAQSAAAIVGVVSAFVISKIITMQTENQQRSQELSRLLNEAKRLVERANKRYFEWYNESIHNRELHSLKEMLREESDFKSPEVYYSRLNFSEFESKSESLELINATIETYRKLQDQHELQPSASLDPTLPEERKTISSERELIDSLLVDIKYNVLGIMNFLQSVRATPESSNLISISIIAMLVFFYAGVIYPLSFLPLPTNADTQLSFLAFFDILFSLKGLFLALLSLIFTALMLLFLSINRHLTLDTNAINELRNFIKLTSYSKYFANYESHN